MCVQLVPYDPEWPRIFEKEAPFIKQALGENCTAIHHFGSTSVPGLCAKPKIDILAVVKDISCSFSLEDFKPRRIVVPTGRYFTKEVPPIHLHIFEEDDPWIEKNLHFCSWLRSHPDDRETYAALKKELAVQYCENNAMEYCRAKTVFIESIMKRSSSDPSGRRD